MSIGNAAVGDAPSADLSLPSMPPALRALAWITAAPVWLAALAMCVGTVVDIVARNVFGAPIQFLSGTLPEIAGWILLAALVPGIPYLVLCNFVRDPATGGRPWTTRLSIAPGAVAALALYAAVAFYIVVDGTLPLAQLADIAPQMLHEYVFYFLVLAIATAALCAGGRPPSATAAAASFGVLIGAVAVLFSSSIVSQTLAVLPCLIISGFIYLIGLANDARRTAPWLIGIGLLLPMTLLTFSGLVTPTEAAALVMLFALMIGLPVRAATQRAGMAPMILAATAEAIALALIVVVVSAVALASAFSGLIDGVTARLVPLGPALGLTIVLGAYFAASVAITPLAAFVLLPVLVPALQKLGFDPLFVGTAIVLTALAALMLRSIDWRAGEAPAAGKFRIGFGLAVFAGYVALVVACALVPDLVLRLPSLLR
ncbi:MAG: hypothetical protein AB7G15_12950 [Alphaproteobacteria bacterium]